MKMYIIFFFPPEWRGKNCCMCVRLAHLHLWVDSRIARMARMARIARVAGFLFTYSCHFICIEFTRHVQQLSFASNRNGQLSSDSSNKLSQIIWLLLASDEWELIRICFMVFVSELRYKRRMVFIGRIVKSLKYLLKSMLQKFLLDKIFIQTVILLKIWKNNLQLFF